MKLFLAMAETLRHDAYPLLNCAWPKRIGPLQPFESFQYALGRYRFRIFHISAVASPLCHFGRAIFENILTSVVAAGAGAMAVVLVILVLHKTSQHLKRPIAA